MGVLRQGRAGQRRQRGRLGQRLPLPALHRSWGPPAGRRAQRRAHLQGEAASANVRPARKARAAGGTGAARTSTFSDGSCSLTTWPCAGARAGRRRRQRRGGPRAGRAPERRRHLRSGLQPARRQRQRQQTGGGPPHLEQVEAHEDGHQADGDGQPVAKAAVGPAQRRGRHAQRGQRGGQAQGERRRLRPQRSGRPV